MLTPDQVLAQVPQRAPFRFIDRLLMLDEREVVGEYTFREDEFFYRGHFPGNPVTPGVILLETMCQTALVAFGIYLVGLEPGADPPSMLTLFTDADVEFAQVVAPGETVRVHGKRIFWRRRKLKAEVRMTRGDGGIVAQGVVSGLGVIRHG